MVSDPAVLNVEIDVDEESFRDEVAAAKRDLTTLMDETGATLAADGEEV